MRARTHTHTHTPKTRGGHSPVDETPAAHLLQHLLPNLTSNYAE